MIRKIIAYETDDGRVFTTEESARVYERMIKLRNNNKGVITLDYFM